jgi:oligopeptidase B
MYMSRRILSLSMVLLMTTSARTTEPPVVEQRPHTLEKHGDTRVDPYFWLRNRDDKDVIAYLEAENEYFRQQMAPLATLREQLFQEIKGRINQDDSTVPYQLGEYYYYRRYEEGLQYPIFARKFKSLDSKEQILLNVNQLAKGHAFYTARLQPTSISPNGRFAAWAADTAGRRFFTIRILDMDTNEMLADVIPNVTSNLVWASDNRTVFYSKQDPETLRSYQVYRHTLGSDPAKDVLVYQEDDDTFSARVSKSKNGQYLLIVSSQTLATECRILEADDPKGEFKVFLARERGHEYSVEQAGEYFYIRTNRDAENFRLMRAPLDKKSEENWEDVVAHRDDVFLAGFSVFREFLVVNERKEGLTRLSIRRWKEASEEHYVAFDEAAYAVSLGTNPVFDTGTLRYVYQSPTTPPSTYDYKVATRERTLLKRDEVLGGFDPANYRAERLAVPARDGASVPVTLVYRQGTFCRDGSRPLLLYGYGSYGSTRQPTFDAAILSLLDRGFVYGVAHVRGSQTLGRRWYEDGKLLKKKNTFTDFIDVAEYLAAEKYADRKRLYAVGGSAGGLLMGAVMNMRPDLFDGIIAHVPWVDVVTTMLDDSIPLTTSEYDEWGNPNNSEYYVYMLSYSPYDNVEAHAYPKLLVTTSLNDSQVQYFEPAKWVAKLRARKKGDNVILLRTNMQAGHGGASGRYERYREKARDYAFLLQCAGLDG